jgi:hypothetical protein
MKQRWLGQTQRRCIEQHGCALAHGRNGDVLVRRSSSRGTGETPY